jgi:hypothetical protein
MRAGQYVGEQAFYLGDGQRDQAGSGGGGWPGVTGGGALGVGAVLQLGGGDGADRQGDHHPSSKSSSTGHCIPAALISRVLASSCPSGT